MEYNGKIDRVMYMSIPNMDALPPEIFDMVVENLSSLDDLGALWLTNRRVASMCANIRAKTLWRIAYRICYKDCANHDEVKERMGSPLDCSVVGPALEEPGSVPFKVRAWLYRRVSMRSFGRSEEVLGRCTIRKDEDLENPYDFSRGSRKLGILFKEWCEEDDVEEREWAKVWLTFKRHLVMQRVQRVGLGDRMVRPEWRRDGEGRGV